MLSSQQLQTRLTNRPGERVTIEQLLEQIESREFTTMNDTVTICNLTLKNGYSVRGESACVDPLGFDVAIGEKIAYDNAVKKLWPLFGFLLAEKRYIANQIAHASDGGRTSEIVDFSLAGFEVAGLTIQKILRLKALYEQTTNKKAVDL